MMDTASVLRLNRQQVAQLLISCAAYRTYLWHHIMPTSERNQMLRNIQALQGRLEKWQSSRQTEMTLSLTSEEKNTIKQLLSGLTQFYGAASPSERRTQQLAELTALRLLIERVLRTTGTQEL